MRSKCAFFSNCPSSWLAQLTPTSFLTVLNQVCHRCSAAESRWRRPFISTPWSNFSKSTMLRQEFFFCASSISDYSQPVTNEWVFGALATHPIKQLASPSGLQASGASRCFCTRGCTSAPVMLLP